MSKRAIVCALFLTFLWTNSIVAQPDPKPGEVPMPPVTEPSDPNNTVVAFLVPPKPSAMFGFGSVVNLSDHPASIPTPGLMSTIVNWLSTEFGLPATYEHPRIELITLQAMVAKRYRGLVPGQNQALSSDVARDLVALYEDVTRTIYLLEGWTGTTPVEESVLVHEMVHHLQNAAGLKYECGQAREKPAYAAQQQWLVRLGRDFFQEFETDPMMILLRTQCPYP